MEFCIKHGLPVIFKAAYGGGGRGKIFLYQIKVPSPQVTNFISLRVRKCGFTHASLAEIRIFTPRDIKFRTILVRKNVFLTSVITSLAFGSCCKLTLVRKRFIALVS